MKISCCMDETINHYEIKLVVHPRNKNLVKQLAHQMERRLGEIQVLDDYRNVYPITLFGVYYFEIVDHKIYAYTEKEVYHVKKMQLSVLKERLKKYGFYQINVRTLVNAKHIFNYQKQVGCRRKIELDNGEFLIVTRHFYKEFDQCIEKEFNEKE